MIVIDFDVKVIFSIVVVVVVGFIVDDFAVISGDLSFIL